MTTFSPGPAPNTVRTADGEVLNVPTDWVLLPPGDAALTRRVKAAGDHWVVAEKKGRKVFSRGIWAAATTIEMIRADLEAERSTEGFAKKKEADAKRREKAQAVYVEDFFGAVVEFLAFHPSHADLAQRLACAVTDHVRRSVLGRSPAPNAFRRNNGPKLPSSPGCVIKRPATTHS